MKVKDFMTKEPITTAADTPIMKALQIMSEHKIKRLPVTKDGQFFGLVTKTMVAEASPSKVTRLSVHELNYLLSKMTVADILLETPITVSPDFPIEEAISLGRKHGIGGFPVVDENNELVGILSTSDVAAVVAAALGLTNPESRRIVIDDSGDRLGTMREIVDVLDTNKIPLLSFLTLSKKNNGHLILILRVACKDVTKVLSDFKNRGITVID
jgi:acetoin utilization protein AcuB